MRKNLHKLFVLLPQRVSLGQNPVTRKTESLLEGQSCKARVAGAAGAGHVEQKAPAWLERAEDQAETIMFWKKHQFTFCQQLDSNSSAILKPGSRERISTYGTREKDTVAVFRDYCSF